MINPACTSCRYHSSSVPYKPARVALKVGKQNCVCAVKLPVLLALPSGGFEVPVGELSCIVPKHITSYTKGQFPEFEEVNPVFGERLFCMTCIVDV